MRLDGGLRWRDQKRGSEFVSGGPRKLSQHNVLTVGGSTILGKSGIITVSMR